MRKRGKSLRFATGRLFFSLGASRAMQNHLDQYTNAELLECAGWMYWCNDERYAWYVMETLALRIVEEHPPDEKLESKFKEGPKKAGSTDENPARASGAETDHDSLSFEKGSN